MRLSLTLAATTLLSLAACSTSSAPVAAQPAAPVAKPIDGGAACNPDALAAFVGQTATEEVLKRAQQAAGAASIRVGGPLSPMTMDFRHDRLTVIVDAQNKIQKLNCV